jgi:hypothetical protein
MAYIFIYGWTRCPKATTDIYKPQDTNTVTLASGEREKVRLGERALRTFMSRKGRTAIKQTLESGDTTWSAAHFKGRKPRTFRDMRGVPARVLEG